MTESDKSLIVRMDSYEKQLDRVHDRVETLEVNRTAMERIAAVTELHINEIRKREEKQELKEEKQDLTMNQLASALTQINQNLHNLNEGQDELESRMNKIEENGRINIMAIIKNIIWIGVPTAVLMYLGLK